MKQIVFIEPNHCGFNHAEVNSCFVKIFAKIFCERSIEIYGDLEHINILKANNESFSTRITRIEPIYIHKTGGILVLIKDFISGFTISRLLLTKTHRNSKVVLLSAMPISHLFAKILNIVLKREIVIILHGELEYIQSRKLSYKLMTRIIRLAFRINKENVKYVFLSPVVYKNFEKIWRMNLFSPIIVDHPYFKKNHTPSVVTIEKPILSSIGVASIRKNSNLIIDLAHGLSSEIKKMKVTLQHIGPVESGIKFQQIPDMKVFGGEKMLERKEFNHLISGITYALFFYGNDMYKLTASGAILDAILMEKPVIAIRNDYFTYYFELLGNIGFLVNDVNEMINLIRRIADNFNIEEYNTQITNLGKAKKYFSIKEVEKNIRKQLNIA